VGAPSGQSSTFQNHLSAAGTMPDYFFIQRAPRAIGYQVIKFNNMADLEQAHPGTKVGDAWEYKDVPVQTYKMEGTEIKSYSERGTIRVKTDDTGARAVHLDSFVTSLSASDLEKAKKAAVSKKMQQEALIEVKMDTPAGQPGILLFSHPIEGGKLKCMYQNKKYTVVDVGKDDAQNNWVSSFPTGQEMDIFEQDHGELKKRWKYWQQKEKLTLKLSPANNRNE